MSKIQKFCRTFPDATENHEPCTVATTIERHRRLLSVDELAHLIGRSPKTLYSWVAAETLPAVRLGASVMFDPHTTANWLRARSA
jgi:excisionase family DNA binding protein